jgi:DNA polymerase I-like protein with 3'-5' exonuclease and polymerase domains
VKYYSIDCETDDPHLTTKGASWVYGDGGIIVTGLYNVRTKTKKAFNGGGGEADTTLLLDKDVTLIGANIVYDLGWLCYEHGLAAEAVQCSLIDVSMAEQTIDEYQRYGLDDLAWKYLKERKGSGELAGIALGYKYKGDFRKHLKKLWDAGYKKEITEYVLSDAEQPAKIWDKQKVILLETACTDAAMTNMALIKIVLGMKQRGVRIDMKKRERNRERLTAIQTELRRDFEKKYGAVNFNSSKQLADLFDKQGVPYRHRIRIKGLKGTPPFPGGELWEQKTRLKETFRGIRVEKGNLVLYVQKQYAGRTDFNVRAMGYDTTCNPNIDKKALSALKKKYPVAEAIVNLKQVTSILDKFLGPKFDRFIVKHGDHDYRIHADFNIVGARQTGRFSSANPNLQQIPSKTVLFAKTENELSLAKLCRELFIPEDGEILVKLDMSGEENRLMAHFAVGRGAEEIRKKYTENPMLDYHAYVGEISGLYEEYGKEIGRKYAKNTGFGLAYGMQLTTMMETFDWTKEEAERITTLYHDGAPFVKATMDKVSDVIVGRGFIKSLAGRRMRLRSYNGKVDTRSAYKGFNKLIQGSAADWLKKAMVSIGNPQGLTSCALLLTVHDELVLSMPVSTLGLDDIHTTVAALEGAFMLRVPMICEPEFGHDYGHCKEIEGWQKMSAEKLSKAVTAAGAVRKIKQDKQAKQSTKRRVVA